MKKKLVLVLVLLVGAMLSTLLVGCGKKTPTEVEFVETVEEPVSEEPIVEEEPTVDTSNVGEVAIEAEEDKTIVTKFGSVTPISTENKMTTYEIVFYDYAFKVTLPQDMGNNYTFKDDRYLIFTNENRTKFFSVLISEASDNFSYGTPETFVEFYTNSSREENWLFEKNENLQMIRCKLKGTFWGFPLIAYKNDYFGMLGNDYQFTYGETEDIFNDEIANNVSKSIEIIDKEDTKESDNVSIETTNTGINSDIATTFGLNNVDLSGINIDVKKENDSVMITLKDKEEGIRNSKVEDANMLFELFKEKLNLYKDIEENPLNDYTFVENNNNPQIVRACYKVDNEWYTIEFVCMTRSKNFMIEIKKVE